MSNDVRNSSQPADRVLAGALSGVRVVAFFWVLDNVYWLVRRYDRTGEIPSVVLAAAFVMLASVWMALHHRRWGWYAMVGMTYASLVDMAVALMLTVLIGLARGYSALEVVRDMEVPIGFVGEGTVFGLMNIALWVLSAFLLDVDRAYVALEQGKRRALASAQFAIAALVVAVYLVALFHMGPTRTALNHLHSGTRLRTWVIPRQGRYANPAPAQTVPLQQRGGRPSEALPPA